MKLQQNKLFQVFLVLAACFLFLFQAYGFVREQFVLLLTTYTLLFAIFFLLINSSLKTNQLWGISLLFRLLFILALPNLSQDFYRFIWDGRMLLQGLNPYLYLPEDFIFEGIYLIAQARELFDGMGMLSATNYTNYPPVNQLCFLLAAMIAPDSIIGAVVVMRLIIIAADMGTYHFGRKLLQKLGMPGKRIFWFMLNPLIIIELTGNLHFEGVMIFFLVWSLYLLKSGNWKLSAVFLALSAGLKLIPLLLLPLLYSYFVGFKKFGNILRQRIWKLVLFYGIVLLVFLLVFIPFSSPELLQHYAHTTGLWFESFQFNASIYGMSIFVFYKLFNSYDFFSLILPAFVFLFILVLSFMKRRGQFSEIISAMVLGLGVYFFCASTVHPWYLSTLVFLSLFTPYRFARVWSFVVILSYQAYSNPDFSEKEWILVLEYMMVYTALFIDIIKPSLWQKPGKLLSS